MFSPRTSKKTHAWNYLQLSFNDLRTSHNLPPDCAWGSGTVNSIPAFPLYFGFFTCFDRSVQRLLWWLHILNMLQNHLDVVPVLARWLRTMPCTVPSVHMQLAWCLVMQRVANQNSLCIVYEEQMTHGGSFQWRATILKHEAILSQNIPCTSFKNNRQITHISNNTGNLSEALMQYNTLLDLFAAINKKYLLHWISLNIQIAI